jgi:hypothetical protein
MRSRLTEVARVALDFALKTIILKYFLNFVVSHFALSSRWWLCRLETDLTRETRLLANYKIGEVGPPLTRFLLRDFVENILPRSLGGHPDSLPEFSIMDGSPLHRMFQKRDPDTALTLGDLFRVGHVVGSS